MQVFIIMWLILLTVGWVFLFCAMLGVVLDVRNNKDAITTQFKTLEEILNREQNTLTLLSGLTHNEQLTQQRVSDLEQQRSTLQ